MYLLFVARFLISDPAPSTSGNVMNASKWIKDQISGLMKTDNSHTLGWLPRDFAPGIHSLDPDQEHGCSFMKALSLYHLEQLCLHSNLRNHVRK